MMAVYFLFLPKAALLSMYLLLKPLLSTLLILASSIKKNCALFKVCALMMLSYWLFYSQSLLGFFLCIAAPFPALSILTIFFDKCQTKSFEDMNISIQAILKCKISRRFSTRSIFLILSNASNDFNNNNLEERWEIFFFSYKKKQNRMS